MKYLLMLVLLASCDCGKKTTAEKKENCKVVDTVGGCDKYECGVKFTDGTFTDRANNPVVGMTMCLGTMGWYAKE